MDFKNLLLKGDKKDLYVKLEASQLLAVHESSFCFAESTKDKYIMITNAYTWLLNFGPK